MSAKIYKFPKATAVRESRGLVLYPIMRPELIENDIITPIRFLTPWIASEEKAMGMAGRLSFVMPEFADDYRLNCEIPELRYWMRWLTAEFPYWFHFCERKGGTLAFVIASLAPITIQRKVVSETIILRVNLAGVAEVVKQLSAGLEDLHRKLGIDHSITLGMIAESEGYVSRWFSGLPIINPIRGVYQ